jgi:DNA-binding MarR family transcriptional regulator
MSEMTDLAPADSMDAWPTGRLLSTAARMVEHAWSEALDQRGLTHAGIVALHLLGEGPLSQTDLARRARVETQTMSRTIERLEREGLVIRESDLRDRRRHVVTRTESGRAAWDATRTLEAEVFPPLADPQAMRDALLEIIRASAAKRWDPAP